MVTDGYLITFSAVFLCKWVFKPAIGGFKSLRATLKINKLTV